MKKYLHFSKILYVDNLYTKLSLVKTLTELKIGFVGTIRKNRIMNKEISKGKIEKNQICLNENQHGTLLTKWRDKNVVYIVSNCIEAETVDKPQFDGTIKTIPK